MAWLIRKTTRDSDGNPKYRYFNGYDPYPKMAWSETPGNAYSFTSQEEGRNYAIQNGVIFTYGNENIDVIQMLEPVL